MSDNICLHRRMRNSCLWCYCIRSYEKGHKEKYNIEKKTVYQGNLTKLIFVLAFKATWYNNNRRPTLRGSREVDRIFNFRRKKKKKKTVLSTYIDERLYETHIFARFLDFGQKILPVSYLKLLCHSKILDS